MNFISDFRNDVLGRNELVFEFSNDGNPGFEGALNKLFEEKKVEKERVVIRGVYGHYGTGNFTVEVYVYDSVKDKENVEPKKKEKKKNE